MGRRRGWDGLREWYWNINTTICKIDSQWEFDIWCGAPNLEGWGEEGGGGGRFWREETNVSLWLIHGDVCQEPAQYCKVITCQLKKVLSVAGQWRGEGCACVCTHMHTCEHVCICICTHQRVKFQILVPVKSVDYAYHWKPSSVSTVFKITEVTTKGRIK